MKVVRITLDVELSDGYSEIEIDNAIADLINDKFGGQVLESKEFIELKPGEYSK
jgi:hypothetical protein